MLKYASQILWLTFFFSCTLAYLVHRNSAEAHSYGKGYLIVGSILLQPVIFIATIFCFLKYQSLNWSSVLSTTLLATAASASALLLAARSFAPGQPGGEILIAHMGLTICTFFGYSAFFAGAALLRYLHP